MASRRPDEKRESLMGAIGAISALMAIMVGLTWIVSAHRIVYASLAPGLGAGAMWKWVPGEFGVERWNWLVLWAQKALADLNGVGFPQWVEFVSVAFQPLALVLAILYVPLVFTLARGRKSVQRRFTPEERAVEVCESELSLARERGSATDIRWHRRKDGTEFFANGFMNAIHDSQGVLVGFAKIMSDETAKWRQIGDRIARRPRGAHPQGGRRPDDRRDRPRRLGRPPRPPSGSGRGTTF